MLLPALPTKLITLSIHSSICLVECLCLSALPRKGQAAFELVIVRRCLMASELKRSLVNLEAEPLRYVA